MNKNPTCPKCQASEVVKNEKVKEKQRFKCKQCNFQFTRLTPRGRPLKEKAMAVVLYSLGLSLNVIAKISKVSTPSVLNWVRNFAMTHYEKPQPKDAILIEIDEMWHFIGSKKNKSGYGKRIAEKLARSSIGNVVAVTKRHS